ncbi:MAG: tetratricopeptide repeat protein [Bacteroidales bacterium]
MKKYWRYIVFLFIVCLISCSTSKNTKVSRFYHAVTANYNIYYNGKLSFDEAFKAMQDGYNESYTDMILMYPVSAQPKDKQTTGGPFDRAIEKGNKAIRMHSIQAKPERRPGWRNNPKQAAFQAQEEYNPFLKECWLLVGEGQFYNADFLQASATFSYIARHYALDERMTATARLWQARCYSEMGWFYEAEDILGKLNTGGIPAGNMNQYAAVYADYLIKNGRFEEAIPYMRTAVKAEKNKRQRTRMKYLLGQMYAELGQTGLAYHVYGEVVRSNPPYDLEFAARIRQTEVVPDANYRTVVKMLERMAKSDKNKELLDQVYYALGNVYMAQGDTARAIENYELGVEKSVRNGMDKAILWVRLGDLYFGMRDYIKAQPCFSGAAGILRKEYKDYERVSKLSAVLDELVVHAEAVHLQDSLQTLARMPEAERLAVIDDIIEQVIKEEKEAKAEAEKEAYLAEQEAKGTGIDRPGMDMATLAVVAATSGESGFYFYNTQTVAQGKTQFQRKWGRRTLEDNWRRREKRVSTFEETAENGEVAADSLQLSAEDGAPLPADSLASDSTEELSNDPKTREYYLQQIPFSEEDIAASNLIIIDGLYNMAMIYKDRLEDLSLSIAGFEDLESRFPDNEHLLESYFQIYLMALRLKDAELADRYKEKLIAGFPDSDYAVAVADPDYEHTIRSMDSVQAAVYESTYRSYLAGDTAAVRRNYEEVSAKYPLATLLPKFMFLHALTFVQKGDAEGFKEALKALLDKYPGADVSELAGEMLKGVLRGREMVQGGVQGMVWNMRFGVGADGSLSAADSARTFSAEKNTPYRMVLMYPAGRIDGNRLLFLVAAYNFSNFMVKEFDLVQEEEALFGMLTIRGFVNFDEILRYYGLIYGKDGYAASLSREIAVIPISDENYETLMHGKTIDEYVAFLEENFGEEAPELIARLQARLDASLPEEGEEVFPDKEEVKPDTTITEETQSVEEEAAAGEEPNAGEEQPPEEEWAPPVETFPQPQQPDSVVVLPADSSAADTAAVTVVPEKPKTNAEIRKEKERAYKERQKQKAKERKEKERANKQKLKEREKARREAQKAAKQKAAAAKKTGGNL